jgi:hypothetical protein
VRGPGGATPVSHNSLGSLARTRLSCVVVMVTLMTVLSLPLAVGSTSPIAGSARESRSSQRGAEDGVEGGNTRPATITTHELIVAILGPSDEHLAAVYLAKLALGSQRAMRQALDVVAAY